jgi:hypothetical protein
MERLGEGTGRASLECGDMLVALPDEGLVVTGVSVVHPAANSVLQQAAHTAGGAASAPDAENSANPVVAGRLLAAPFLPYPWSPTGAWAVRQCSVCAPWPMPLPPLQTLGLMPLHLLCDGSPS